MWTTLRDNCRGLSRTACRSLFARHGLRAAVQAAGGMSNEGRTHGLREAVMGREVVHELEGRRGVLVRRAGHQLQHRAHARPGRHHLPRDISVRKTDTAPENSGYGGLTRYDGSGESSMVKPEPSDFRPSTVFRLSTKDVPAATLKATTSPTSCPIATVQPPPVSCREPRWSSAPPLAAMLSSDSIAPLRRSYTAVAAEEAASPAATTAPSEPAELTRPETDRLGRSEESAPSFSLMLSALSLPAPEIPVASQISEPVQVDRAAVSGLDSGSQQGRQRGRCRAAGKRAGRTGAGGAAGRRLWEARLGVTV